MSTLKYLYKISLRGFNFIKLFENEQAAVDYCYDKCAEGLTHNSEGRKHHPEFHHDILSSVTGELTGRIEGGKWKNVELFYRWNPSNDRPGPEKFIVGKFKLDDLSNCEVIEKAYTKLTNPHQIGVGYKVKIEVQLRYDQDVEEVKIPGVPYQPATTVKKLTEWYTVYEMYEPGYSNGHTCLSINPEERTMMQGDFRVRRKSRDYFHVISKKFVELLITEQD